MPISFDRFLSRLLQTFIEAHRARQALQSEKPELSLEDFKRLHQQRLERDLARERQRIDVILCKPFSGLL